LHDPEMLAWLPLGGYEAAIVIVLALLIFYGKRLPDIGRNLGRGIVEFKKGISGVDDDEKKKTPAAPAPPDQDSGKTS